MEKFNDLLSKKFGIIIGAGYLLRDMALSDVSVDKIYPVIVGVVTIVYLACQTILDKKIEVKNDCK